MKIEEIRERIEAAERDVVADGYDWDQVAGEVIREIARDVADTDEELAREILRTELGVGIFPDDPDPIEELRGGWEQILVPEPIETPEERDERLAEARARRAAIRSELPLAGDFTRRTR